MARKYEEVKYILTESLIKIIGPHCLDHRECKGSITNMKKEAGLRQIGHSLRMQEEMLWSKS